MLDSFATNNLTVFVPGSYELIYFCFFGYGLHRYYSRLFHAPAIILLLL